MMNLSQELVNGVAKLFPDAIFYKKTTEKVVALTIDDAPCYQDYGDYGTKAILKAIAKHNQKYSHLEPATATFFVISSHLCPDTEIISEIMTQGHEIGNHGVIDETHAWLTPQQFEQQLKEAHEKLLELTGKNEIRWYRPGRGFYNQKMLKAIAHLTSDEHYDLQLVLASMVPFDTFDMTNQPWLTAMYTKQMVFPGAILVFHANSTKIAQNTAIALEIILEDLRKRDYRIVTVSQLLDQD
ncbi:polysaccharide deacetylase family protein [Pleurocapsales cyanobacterium LEGE 10410]|nr:polysaccharide deacetylase family protein [Pleurocapsales cyanobacterium LEGE 10410]